MVAWQRVNGRLIRGARQTSNVDRNSPYRAGTLELQFPMFRERGLDLSACFRGTLNVLIEPRTWAMVPAEPTFRNVLWHKNHIPEDFFFSQCRLMFGRMVYPAWVYCASPGKPHYLRGPSLLEIIAEKVPEIKYGDMVALEINPEDIRISDPP